MKYRIHFAIHDLNQQGGQDRSTLEIIKRLANKFPIAIHAFNINPRIEKASEFLVKPILTKPVLLKSIYFYIVLIIRELLLKIGKYKQEKAIWHTTGVSHITSDIIQLQFIHTAWRKERKLLDLLTRKSILRTIYDEIFELLNIILEKLCFQEGKTYIAISNTVARDLRNCFGIKTNIHVIHHGVDLNIFHPINTRSEDWTGTRRKFQIPLDHIVGIFVGSYERKGLEPLLHSLPLLESINKNKFTLLIVGDGNRSYFQKVLQESFHSCNVVIMPKQKNIEKLFQIADFFVLPTLYEPFGLVVLEAMAVGLPVIVSRCAGSAELITPQKDGLILENPKDATEIARNLDFLLNLAPEKLCAMGIAAQEVAKKNSWDRVAENYSQVLETFLHNLRT